MAVVAKNQNLSNCMRMHNQKRSKLIVIITKTSQEKRYGSKHARDLDKKYPHQTKHANVFFWLSEWPKQEIIEGQRSKTRQGLST